MLITICQKDNLMKKISFLFCLFCLSLPAFAQNDSLKQNSILNELGNLKISGYIQTQWQYGEQAAALKVGAPNTGSASFNRLGIRRGHLFFLYDNKSLFSGLFDLIIVDKYGANGVSLRIWQAYFDIKDPWGKTCSIRSGIFNRPFGYEIGYPSSLTESTERSRIEQTLFPDEGDLGAMIILQPATTSPLSFIKFEGGLFAGNGVNPDVDSRKDFIGHLSASKSAGSSIQYGGGISHYNGGVYQTNNNVYTMVGNKFVLNDDAGNTGKYAKREYLGFDARFRLQTIIGVTQVRGEYIWGTQPGTATSSMSPNSASLPAPQDTYIRPVMGWYAMLVQKIKTSPFSAVIKYDVYNPNTKVKNDEIGLNGTSVTDIRYATFGLGCLFDPTSQFRVLLYYEIVKNETSANMASLDWQNDFSKDRKDNIFTLRLQYKF